jgi:hypothetical protein
LGEPRVNVDHHTIVDANEGDAPGHMAKDLAVEVLLIFGP